LAILSLDQTLMQYTFQHEWVFGHAEMRLSGVVLESLREGDGMTFDISVVVAKEESPFEILSDQCFCCGKVLRTASDGPVVSYDGFVRSENMSRVLMHRDCAFAMAQRLICDAWPNRRAGDTLMKNDR
jgi:hypothetical protein